MLRWWTKHAASRSLLVESPVVLMALKCEDGKEKKKKGSNTSRSRSEKKPGSGSIFWKKNGFPYFVIAQLLRQLECGSSEIFFFYFILDPNARALSRCPLCPSVQFPFKLARRDTICFVFFFLRKSIKNGESTWSRPHARHPVFVKRFLARMFQISCRKSRGIGLRTSHHRLYIYAKMFHNVMGREALQ